MSTLPTCDHEQGDLSPRKTPHRKILHQIVEKSTSYTELTCRSFIEVMIKQ
jgi:hypothetical protein